MTATATATRANSRDLGRARKEYANRVEEATGYSIAWEYCPLESAWVFWLVDPCGDTPDGPFFEWNDLVDYCQDAIDEYEALYASIEPKLYDEISDADPGL
jgi:hypothetical protein